MNLAWDLAIPGRFLLCVYKYEYYGYNLANL